MTHLEEQNVDAFTDTVKDHDSISRLDQWLVLDKTLVTKFSLKNIYIFI